MSAPFSPQIEGHRRGVFSSSFPGQLECIILFFVNSNTLNTSSSMYCPRCGVQASHSDTKFCRACGADLTLVSQAMAGQISWRTHLLTRLDNFFLSRREYEDRESAREGGWNLFLGASLLAIKSLEPGNGRRGPSFLGSAFIIFISVIEARDWEYALI